MNPTAAIRLLLALVTVLSSACRDPNPDSIEATDGREHTAILFFDTEGKLQIEYEGTGYRQFSSTGDSEVEFRAIHLDGEDGVDIQDESLVDALFSGTYSTKGPEERELSIRLSVESKVPLTIRLMGISKNGSDSAIELFEKRFSLGAADFEFDGKIISYYEAQKK